MRQTLRRAAAALPIALLSLTTPACDSILGPDPNALLREQLEQARHAWQQQGPTRYAMVVTRTGSTGEAITARLVVDADQIESALYVATGEPLEAAVRAEFRTVPGLFALIDDAISRRAPLLHMRYDPQYGFPVEIAIDYDATTLVRDITFVVSTFEPLD